MICNMLEGFILITRSAMIYDNTVTDAKENRTRKLCLDEVFFNLDVKQYYRGVQH